MIKGINDAAYIDLSKYIDSQSFVDLHPEICKAFATAEHLSALGNLDDPGDYVNWEIYNNSFTPLSDCHKTFLSLPADHPIRIGGTGLVGNEFAKYLKYALGGYDLYSFYVLCDFTKDWRNSSGINIRQEFKEFFPRTINWLHDLIDQKIFSHIGRATFFVLESGGISFEHKDPSVDPEYPEKTSEFIHFRCNLDRPFYIRDIETSKKTYIDTPVAYWNDQDYHGGDPALKPTYSLRVDGEFNSEFRKKFL